MTQLVPAREKERLIALRRLKVIDSDPEAQFDAVCRFACSYFQVPIAYIAFIDEGRQLLKAACGIDLTTVPRSGTICSRTILLDRVLIVRDALKDVRFANNPYVVNTPHIRFYAGAPLSLAEGIRVGTICLVDKVPRQFPKDRADALRGLADYVVGSLLMRAAHGSRCGSASSASSDAMVPHANSEK